MKTGISLLLGISLLFSLITGCSKSDMPAPDKVFRDVGTTMEENEHYEQPTCYYNYFRFQNDSDHTLYFGMTTDVSSSERYYYIRPGEQATHWFTMEYAPGLGRNHILIEKLTALGIVELYFNAPSPKEMQEESWWRIPDLRKDTCAYFVFKEVVTSSEATPLDQSQWKFEKYSDHRVRWTYRVTNADHGVAVRQTLERWADKTQG